MVQHAAESIFNGTNVTNVLIGVAGSLISLWLLFCIKPSLRLTLEEGILGGHWWKPAKPLGRKIGKHRDWVWCSYEGLKEGTPSEQGTCEKCHKQTGHYRLEIENLGLAKVVEVEVRLKLIRKGNKLATREATSLKPEKLLELSGKWYEARRRKPEIKRHTGDRYFHRVLPCDVSLEKLKDEDDYYLIQVWARHGFTNFGRVHKLRLGRTGSGTVGSFTVEDPDKRRRKRAFARLASLIADPCHRPYVLTPPNTTPQDDSTTPQDDSTKSPDPSPAVPDASQALQKASQALRNASQALQDADRALHDASQAAPDARKGPASGGTSGS
jgi:hypothetical protein